MRRSIRAIAELEQDRIEEAPERQMHCRVLGDLFDEDEEPGERLMRRGLRRRVFAGLAED
jgi:hypothetical protein